MAKDTENIILNAARRQFVQNGFAATRMQQIADEAGINKAMLHYYFRSKDKLFHEIVGQILNTIMPKLAKVIGHSGTTLEKIENIVDTYISTILEHPDIPFFIMSELSQGREKFVEELQKRAHLFPAVQNFVLQIMQEMQEGKIREYPPIHLLLNVVSMCVFPFMAKPVFSQIINVSEENFNELMEERKSVVVDFVKNALKID